MKKSVDIIPGKARLLDVLVKSSGELTEIATPVVDVEPCACDSVFW